MPDSNIIEICKALFRPPYSVITIINVRSNMNKTLLATLIGSSILLAGCNESTDSTDSDDVDSPIVSFAPFATTAVLSTPNDLVLETDSDSDYYHRLTGSFDAVDRDNITTAEYSASADVYYSTSQLDGWGLGTPFTIEIELPDSSIYQTELDSDSVKQDGVVYIFKCKAATSVILGTCDDSFVDITQLTYGVDYSLSTNDDGIVVTPLKPFEANTGYFLGVTSLVKDSFGQSVTRSTTFDTYSEGTGYGTADEISLNALLAGTNTLLAGFTTLDAADFMYSATWTTQDVETTAQAVMDTIVDDANANYILDSLTYQGVSVKYILENVYGVTFEAGSDAEYIAENTEYWKGELKVPYYLPYPGSVTYNASFTCNYSTLCGNWQNVNGHSPWKNDATPIVSTEFALFEDGDTSDPTTIKVQLLIPNDDLLDKYGHTEVKLAQYVHGITAIKENGFLISPSLAAYGFAVIAIDQPLHGERSFDYDEDGVYELTATSTSYGDAYANGDSSVFANLSSLLTARDNLRQAASDQLALRWALANADLTTITANTDTDKGINQTSISMVGVSLGSMIGTAAQGMSEIRDDADSAFDFTASALTVGGAQVGPIMGYSKSFGPIVKEALVATTGFSGGVASSLGYTTTEAVILQAASGDTYGTAAQAAVGMTAAQAQAYLGGTEAQASAEFQAMINLGYSGFLSAFINGAQVVVDAGDALIWSTKTTTTPTLATQVIGNGSTNLSDQTVPNDVIDDGFPIAGTLGWLEGLDLTKTSATTTAAGLRVYTNFLVGKHTSAVDSTHVDGVTESATAAAAATTEMQNEIAKFLYFSGAYLEVADATGTVIE